MGQWSVVVATLKKLLQRIKNASMESFEKIVENRKAIQMNSHPNGYLK